MTKGCRIWVYTLTPSHNTSPIGLRGIAYKDLMSSAAA